MLVKVKARSIVSHSSTLGCTSTTGGGGAAVIQLTIDTTAVKCAGLSLCWTALFEVSPAHGGAMRANKWLEK